MEPNRETEKIFVIWLYFQLPNRRQVTESGTQTENINDEIMPAAMLENNDIEPHANMPAAVLENVDDVIHYGNVRLIAETGANLLGVTESESSASDPRSTTEDDSGNVDEENVETPDENVIRESDDIVSNDEDVVAIGEDTGRNEGDDNVGASVPESGNDAMAEEEDNVGMGTPRSGDDAMGGDDNISMSVQENGDDTMNEEDDHNVGMSVGERDGDAAGNAIRKEGESFVDLAAGHDTTSDDGSMVPTGTGKPGKMPIGKS